MGSSQIMSNTMPSNQTGMRQRQEMSNPVVTKSPSFLSNNQDDAITLKRRISELEVENQKLKSQASVDSSPGGGGQSLGAYMNKRENDRDWMSGFGGGNNRADRPITAS